MFRTLRCRRRTIEFDFKAQKHKPHIMYAFKLLKQRLISFQELSDKGSCITILSVLNPLSHTSNTIHTV